MLRSIRYVQRTLRLYCLTFDARGIRPSMSGPPLSSPAISVNPKTTVFFLAYQIGIVAEVRFDMTIFPSDDSSAFRISFWWTQVLLISFRSHYQFIKNWLEKKRTRLTHCCESKTALPFLRCLKLVNCWSIIKILFLRLNLLLKTRPYYTPCCHVKRWHICD